MYFKELNIFYVILLLQQCLLLKMVAGKPLHHILYLHVIYFQMDMREKQSYLMYVTCVIYVQ
jgi:hypothetical protein